MKRLVSTPYIIFLIILFGILHPTLLTCQEKENRTPYYSWFDQMIGKTNSGIFNGIVYVEKYIVINEKHKFFNDPNFITGSVVYDGQSYFDLDLKYDLFEDNILLKHIGIMGAPVILLNKEKISEFTIDNHNFINISFSTTKNKNLSGFFETIVTNDSLKLFKKHEKTISRKLNQSFRYYEFKANNSYYIYYQGNYHPLNKMNDFNVIFPSYRVQLKQIFNQYEKSRKKDVDSFNKAVLNDLTRIIIGHKTNEL